LCSRIEMLIGLAHWIGACDGAGILDKKTVGQLKGFQKKLTGEYEKDSEILKDIVATLDQLRPAAVKK
jgi:hypothetical protein